MVPQGAWCGEHLLAKRNVTFKKEAASPFHIGHKESAVGLLREDRNPGGTSLFHNIPHPSLKKAFDQKRMILIHSHAEGHNNGLLKQILYQNYSFKIGASSCASSDLPLLNRACCKHCRRFYPHALVCGLQGLFY